MSFLDWITIPWSTRQASTTMLRLVCQWKGRPLPKGRPSQNYGVVTMNTTPEHKHRNTIWTKCLQTVAKKRIFSLTTQEIAEAQKAYGKLKHCFKRNPVIDKGLEVSLVDNTHAVCKEGRMIIPKPLQWCALLWYHHYLQHLGLLVLKKQWILQCTGKVCVPQSG